MLFLVNRSTGRSASVAQVARELNLILRTHGDPASLASNLAAETRRIACLEVDEITSAAIEVLKAGPGAQPLGVIVCGRRDAPEVSGSEALIAALERIDNVEWIDDAGNIDDLRHAARSCWQRMLRITPDELRVAMDNREFVIQYQPKVERISDAEWKTREAESLLRWRHPVLGLIGPLEFLPEAEAFGLMGALTELVLEEAAVQLSRWHRRELDLNSCINLAPSLLRDSELADRYEVVVREHGLDCSRFTFEVAESDIANSDAPHLKVLQSLRKKGFRVSLDDFGVAASSLSAFEQLPFDEIKIHAAALQRARASAASQKVLAAVTGLAHNLGVSVCAEGVEDHETYEFLKTIGCDKMQGYLISEAVMPEIIRRFYTAGAEVDRVA